MTELKRPNHAGMRHIALNVLNVNQMLAFYVDLIGMEIEWQPDLDNIYLTSGNDNLAIHRVDNVGGKFQSLDHLGFILDEMNEVDLWYDYLSANGVRSANPPKTHRDGARSFYCYDPGGNVVQMIYHPPISAGKQTR